MKLLREIRQAALTLLENDDPHDYGGRFISVRDRAFLDTAL